MRDSILITAAFLLVACDEKQKAEPRTPPPAVAVVAPTPASSAVPTPPPPVPEVDLTAPFAEKMPNGWRDLRFGMNEAEVRKLILKARKSSDDWEKSQATSLPVVHLGLKYVNDISVDEKRFHHWTIWKLDDGAEFVRAWFDGGKLVAIQHTGKIKLEAFLPKASEAYGAEPRVDDIAFFDATTGRKTERKVAVWRSSTATALLWDGGDGSPKLLMWSNPAMEEQANKYQASLDGMKQREIQGEKAKEKSTTF